MLHVRNFDKISLKIMMIFIMLRPRKVLLKARTFITVDDFGAFV